MCNNTLGKFIHEKIRVGSSAFFSEYPDYIIDDIDYVILVDEPTFFKDTMQLVSPKTKEDRHYWRNMTKDEFIDLIISRQTPMEAGMFLVPELCKKFNFTIEDLKRLEEMFNNMDPKHSYEKIIYRSYIENNDFILTKEQRLEAYNEYKLAKNFNN